MIMSGANLNLPYGMEKLKSNVKSAPAKQAIARMNQTPADIKAMAAQSALINANKKTEKLKTEPKKSGFPTSRARIGGAIKKAKEEPKKNKGRTTFVSSNKGLKK